MGGAHAKIIAVGAAVQDVFLSHSDEFKPVSDKTTHEQFLKLELGAKADVNNVTYSTGGGATNAAVTFARQGLSAVFMGVIGHDPAGRAVLDVLDHEGVDTSYVGYSHRYKTGFSVLLLAPNGERTVLTYRGASTHYQLRDFRINGMQADWLYVSTLNGEFTILHALFTEARKQGIKIMFNPGKKELAHPQKLRGLLEDVEVLIVNKDEAQKIITGETLEELVRHAHHYVPVAIITDGPNGLIASDRTVIIRAGMYQDVRVVDRTGAGDALGSGFLACWARGKSLKESIIFASANSTSVVSHIGAKTGILSQGVKLHHMPLHEKTF
ncbi:MAG: carbohydrate kinase family protein [Candidatus Saccharimonadales bacterium]